MRTTLFLQILLSLMLSNCTNFNLVEQLSPEDRRVPVAIPPLDAQYVYEWQGAYYLPITVAMAKEDMPLLTSGLSDARAVYCSSPRYTIDADTAGVYLFRLTPNELSGKLRTPASSPADSAAFVPQEDFPYNRAKRHRLKKIYPGDNIVRPISTGWNKAYRVWIPNDSPYPIGILPVHPGTRSRGNKLAYALLLVPDAAGNIVIKGAEITIGSAVGAIVALPLGILQLCGVRLP